MTRVVVSARRCAGSLRTDDSSWQKGWGNFRGSFHSESTLHGRLGVPSQLSVSRPVSEPMAIPVETSGWPRSCPSEQRPLLTAGVRMLRFVIFMNMIRLVPDTAKDAMPNRFRGI